MSPTSYRTAPPRGPSISHEFALNSALLVEAVPIDVLAERLGSTRNALYKALHDARQRLRSALVESGHLDSTHDGSAS